MVPTEGGGVIVDASMIGMVLVPDVRWIVWVPIVTVADSDTEVVITEIVFEMMTGGRFVVALPENGGTMTDGLDGMTTGLEGKTTGLDGKTTGPDGEEVGAEVVCAFDVWTMVQGQSEMVRVVASVTV